MAEMLSLDGASGREWLQAELGAVLRHQLTARVDFDLGTSVGVACPSAAPPDEVLRPARSFTFAELLHDPAPPLDVLRRTKTLAKACRNDPNGPIPREVATVLYFASILVALMRCGQRITHLDDAGLRDGIEWILAQSWVDTATRGLFEQGMVFMRPPETP